MDETPSKLPPSGVPDSQSCVSPSSAEELSVQLRELKQDLVERERALAVGRKQLEKLEGAMAEREITFRASQTAHRKVIASLNSQIDHGKAAYHALIESRAWKLTGPIRMAGRVWKKASQAGRQLLRLKEKPESAGSVQTPTQLFPPSASGQPIPDTEKITMPGQMLDRFQTLEGALRDMLAGVKHNTAGGKYIHRVSDRIDAGRLEVKVVAFYAPQYLGRQAESESVRQADWGDVHTTLPRYVGHYQPHVPDEFGHCDQRIPGVLEKQVALAKQYGIYGFCFECSSLRHDHLFTNSLKQLLDAPTLDIRFCICFRDEAVATDDESLNSNVRVFLDRMAPAFSDTRYIRVRGRPLLVVSGATTAAPRSLRDEARKLGLEDPYLVILQSDLKDDLAAGFDAVVEDPISCPPPEITAESTLIDPDFEGHVYSYAQMMERYSQSVESRYETFKNVVTGFDNEPLRPGAGTSFAGANPELYARWLDRCCRLTMARRPEERLVFVSSWNNWAEGEHLEPDRSFGYGYLHATANVLRNYHRDPSLEKLIEDTNALFSRRSDAVIIFHCYYEDLIEPTFERYFANAKNLDLIVTLRFDISCDAIAKMRKLFPNIYFLRHENRGRDMRPFLLALRHARLLGYRFGCKVHTKKTPHAENEAGEVWRKALIERLIGSPDSSVNALRILREEPDLGLLVPSGSVTDLREVRHHIDNTFWLDRLLPRLDRADLVGNYDFSFPAGSMYWFRMEALAGLDSLVLSEDAFEQEFGQRDGTLAHTLERLISLHAFQRGFQMKEIDLSDGGSPSANAIVGRKSAQTLAPSS